MSARARKILQVALRLDPGGTERLIIELVKRVHPRIPTAVCCLDGGGLWAAEIESLGIPIVSLDRRPGFHLGTAKQLAAVVRDVGATVLHCHQYSPFVYGRLAAVMTGTPIVFTEHGRHSDAPPSTKRALVNRALVLGVPDLFAVSHDLREHMRAEGFPARVGVIWNGIDPGDAPGPADRIAARRTLGFDDSAVIVGSIGRLDPVKDFPTLVAAFAEARASEPALRLAIVGEGPDRPAVERAIVDAGVGHAVRLLGHRQDARQLLAAFDIYANSSISEGVSLTLLEAMAAECPIVATRVGGTPEVVVDGETGLLVPARSSRALSDSFRALVADRPRARLFGSAGRRRVLAHFTLDQMVESYMRLYDAHA